jgi:hypothetical protein
MDAGTKERRSTMFKKKMKKKKTEEHPYLLDSEQPHRHTWAWYAWSLAPYDAQKANERTSELSPVRR